MSSTLPSINTLNSLVDIAPAAQLRPYDDGRTWVLVLDSALSLGEVAHASMQVDNQDQFDQWFNERKVAFYQFFQQITKDDSIWFACLYFDNAYFLKYHSK